MAAKKKPAKRMGRPPSPNPRTEVLRVRLTPDEMHTLRNRAQAAEQQLGPYVHDILFPPS